MIKVLVGQRARTGGLSSSISWEALADLIANQPNSVVHTGERIVQIDIDDNGLRFTIESL